jgi:DNA-binding MarR family transcriptional regulator
MFELSRYIPYLVRRTTARIDEIIRPQLAAVGLTLEMWRVVISIYEHGPQSLGDLARRTSVNLSTLSRLVGAMERAKLVRRRRVVGNGRMVKIDLLRLGRKRCQAFLPFAVGLERQITKRFSGAELRTLRELLGRLYAAVAEDSAAPAAKSARKP